MKLLAVETRSSLRVYLSPLTFNFEKNINNTFKKGTITAVYNFINNYYIMKYSTFLT